MSNILYITASIRSDSESVSRGLGQRIVDGLAAKTGASVTTRDLAANDLPYVSAERFAANLTPAADRTPHPTAPWAPPPRPSPCSPPRRRATAPRPTRLR